MTLDASAYPHILESVLTHADRGALLSLRATSRSLRDAVDARLAEHVKLHIPIGGLHVFNHGPRVDIKLLRERMRRLEVTGMEGGRLPVFMEWAGAIAPLRRRREPDSSSTAPLPLAPGHSTAGSFDADQSLYASISPTPEEEDPADVAARRAARKAIRARCAAALSHAAVIDITSFPRSWLRDGAPDLIASFTAHTYRFHSPWCEWNTAPFNRAHTAVAFTPLVLRGGQEWVIPSPYTSFRGSRLVLNLTGFTTLDPSEASSHPSAAHELQVIGAGAEVVINYASLAANTQPLKGWEGARDAGALPAGHLGLVFPTARVIFKNPTVRFTLVGASDVDPVTFGYVCPGPAQDDGEIRRVVVGLVDRMRSWYPNYWTVEGIESLPERITMMSLEEYRESVGEERFALETVA